MPLISSFYGITIHMYMFTNEYNPSHIHVYYGSENAVILIATSEVIEGELPKNALLLVKEWMELHREELQRMWDTKKFKTITPLDE